MTHTHAEENQSKQKPKEKKKERQVEARSKENASNTRSGANEIISRSLQGERQDADEVEASERERDPPAAVKARKRKSERWMDERGKKIKTCRQVNYNCLGKNTKSIKRFG